MERYARIWRDAMGYDPVTAGAAVLAELRKIDEAMVARPDMQDVLLRHRTVLYLRAAAIRAVAQGMILQDTSATNCCGESK